jgi:hypothetical protein
MRSKIKIRTSSPYKATSKWALYGDEVRILNQRPEFRSSQLYSTRVCTAVDLNLDAIATFDYGSMHAHAIEPLLRGTCWIASHISRVLSIWSWMNMELGHNITFNPRTEWPKSAKPIRFDGFGAFWSAYSGYWIRYWIIKPGVRTIN